MAGSQDFAADPRNADLRIYLDGVLVPRAQARVSVFDAGFVLERFCEPTVDDATVARHPCVYEHQIVAYFLQARVRKPA